MRKTLSVVLAAFVTLTLVEATILHAQSPQLVLREILHESLHPNQKQPHLVSVDAKAGFVAFTIDYAGCSETYRFAYDFDQDMSVLQFEQEYGFSASMTILKGDCGPGANPMAAALSPGAASFLLNKIHADPPYNRKWTKAFANGGGLSQRRLYPRPFGSGFAVGQDRGKFSTEGHWRNYDDSYAGIGFSIQAVANLDWTDRMFYEVVFVYQQLGRGGPAVAARPPARDAAPEQPATPVAVPSPHVGEPAARAQVDLEPQLEVVRPAAPDTAPSPDAGERPDPARPAAPDTAPSPDAGRPADPARPAAPVAVPSPDVVLAGDSDGDHRITAKDAEAALQMSVGLRPVDLNLDVDQNGQVQSADARQILQEASRTVGPAR